MKASTLAAREAVTSNAGSHAFDTVLLSLA
jgi:hypothetical protein